MDNQSWSEESHFAMTDEIYRATIFDKSNWKRNMLTLFLKPWIRVIIVP
jgi:hypothetical protein